MLFILRGFHGESGGGFYVYVKRSSIVDRHQCV